MSALNNIPLYSYGLVVLCVADISSILKHAGVKSGSASIR